MKKLLIFVGSIFFLLLVILVSVPFFVDVDQYRPQIVAQANSKLNGTLELGKLKLSLWGAVKIHADSIKLTINGFDKPFLTTDQFHLEIPFSSVLAGHPQVVAVLSGPKISVVKNSQGEMNVLKLMKAEPAKTTAIDEPITMIAAADAKTAKAPAPQAAVAPVATAPVADAKIATPAPAPQIPAILIGASVGIQIEKGFLDYVDAVAHANYAVNNLDFDARNLGLSSTMTLTFNAPVKGATPQMSFDGSVKGAAEITPVLVGNAVRSARGTVSIDASALQIEMKNGVFHKSKEMPLTAKLSIDGDEKNLLIKSLEVIFDEFKVYGKGLVQTAPSLDAKFEINTDPLHLDRIQAFVPMVTAYGLKGAATLNVSIETNGVVHHAHGDVKLSDGEFFMASMLKAPMHFSMQAGFTENSLNLMRASLTAPDSEVQLQGNITNFLAPQFSISLNGKSFNVDKALVLPAPGAAPKKSAALFEEEAVAAETPASSVNPMLAMAANPMIAKAAGTVTAQLGRLTVYGTNIDSISIRMQLQNMLLKISQASLKAFGGQADATADFELKSPGMNYKSQGKVAGVSAQEAFATYFPKYKNTLEGKMNANWNVSGQIYPQTQIMHALKGGAKLQLQDGALKSVDFQSSINSIIQKVPMLKDKRPVVVDNGFKEMSAEVKFLNGVTTVDPMQVSPRGKGFEIKGKSRIEENMQQESFFDVYDPQHQLPQELGHGSGAALSMHLTGLITSPQTDYGYTVSRLASNLAKGAGKSLLQNLGKSLLKGGGGGGSAPSGGVGDALKKLGF